MTDALQSLPRPSERRRSDGDPKAHRRRHCMLSHGSQLIDTERSLAGDIVSVTARLVEYAGAHCWFAQVEFAAGSFATTFGGGASLPDHIPDGVAARVRDGVEAHELEMVAVSGTYNVAHPDDVGTR